MSEFSLVKVMACSEIVDLVQAMRIDTRGRLNTFERNLQSRFGDPRVYEAEREAQARMEAQTVHAKSRQTSKLLQNAYDTQLQKNRAKHIARMAKFRNCHAASSRLQSPEAQPVTHNSAQLPSATVER
jgi:hypothetical protein